MSAIQDRKMSAIQSVGGRVSVEWGSEWFDGEIVEVMTLLSGCTEASTRQRIAYDDGSVHWHTLGKPTTRTSGAESRSWKLLRPPPASWWVTRPRAATRA